MAFSTEDTSTVPSEAPELPGTPPHRAPLLIGIFIRNAASNVVRIGALGLIAIFLPTYLTHHLPVKVYGAWVLVLQLGAYVGYLNLGVQTALSKYISEYETRRDQDGCGRCASVALRLMLFACLIGIILSVALALRVPALFRDMPLDLLPEVRISVLLVGISLSIGLASSVFSGIFLGLQRYQIPMVVSVLSRLLYAAVICAAVSLHLGLIAMAAATAVINLLTSLAEIAAWRRFAGHIKISLLAIDSSMVRQMLAYCSILTVWSACMLIISGMDVTIVGHYAFGQVAYYSIANSPTNLLLTIFGAIMGPLLPAASALSVRSTPQDMGEVLLRSTRYSTVVLLATGLPMMLTGYPLLRAWVGPDYASHSIVFLDVLLLANILRNLCSPYTMMVVATSRQGVATVSAISEGVVNLTTSILLAKRFGAIGVAAGTLIGAVAGVALHFAVSMHYTQTAFAVSRARLFLRGLLFPSAMALPSAVVALLWWTGHAPERSLFSACAWLLVTGLLGWYVSLLRQDREMARELLRRGLRRASGHAF